MNELDTVIYFISIISLLCLVSFPIIVAYNYLSWVKDCNYALAGSRESLKMLNWGLKKFDTIRIAKKDEIFANLKVWQGKKNKVNVVTSEDYYLTVPKRKRKTIKAVLEYEGPIQTPIKKGEKLGQLNVYVSGELRKQIDILSAENIKRSNIFLRLFHSLNYLVWGDV